MANRRRPNSSGNFQQPRNDGGSSGRHPVYHGIRLRAGKWVSEIREPNQTKRIWLGTYATPEMAAAAYDVAALALKGTNVLVNFPDSVISSTLPEHPTADDIRSAAARAAAARAPLYETGGGSGINTAPPAGAYMDDERNLWSDMAEGMLLSPPRMDSSPPDDHGADHSGGGNLWNY